MIKVVLCDDVPEVRELTRLGLEEDPALRVVAEAETGEALLGLLPDISADVLLIDLSMPGMDGLEAIRRARVLAPELGIVVFSGFAEGRMASLAREVGADRYVEKGQPIDLVRSEVRAVAGDRSEGAAPVPAAPAPDPAPTTLQLLRDSERRFRTLAVSLPVGIFETDPSGACVFVNDAFLEITGRGEEEALRDGWTAGVHDEDAERLGAAWRASVTAGSSLEEELRFRTPGGTIRWVLTRAVKLPHEPGEQVGFLGIVVDLSARKRAEMDRNTAYEELLQSNADLEQFAYAASHDLSEPLRVIGGFAELLRDRHSAELDEDARRFVERIVSGVDRMQRLIDALLAYSRAGRATIVTSQVEVGEVIDEVLVQLDGPVRERGVAVSVGTQPSVMAEPTMLGQVFQNLISNAVKFTDNDTPEIRIEATRENGGWQFSVADNGPGIDAAQTDRVFEVFERLHGREYPGTGIGLAICRRIVERHGGRIGVRPAEGGGSEFTFTIPDPA